MNRWLWTAAILALPTVARADDPKGAEFFEKKIRPVLIQHCYECHATDGKAKGGLVLDTREGLVKGGKGGPIVVVGRPEDSSLIDALHHNSLKMPPKQKLPAAVIADFELWVKAGAPDPRVQKDYAKKAEPSRWLTSTPERKPAPAVKDAAWPRSDIDRHVLATLEAKGIAPNADAPRLPLIRRLTFDLIGLPPTPEEVDAYLKDTSANATEKLVDRLLASRHFGERWGRHWLDVAHFAENSGVVKYNQLYPYAWRYRDWVIDAFNADMPYDRFVKAQLAGDLIPARSAAERDHLRIGTGFLVMGRLRNDNKADLQVAMDNIDEQIDAVTQGFLGLTVSCARCHDHKFDPISTQDYYAMAGIFNSTALQLKGEGGGKKAGGGGKGAKLASDEAPAAFMGVSEGAKIGDLRVCIRGDVKVLGPSVKRGIPTVFASAAPDAAVPSGASGRLQLADWIASPTNPLTARVMANRVWHHLFGRGLVPTVDNFGSMSEPCSNPDLLDHLAVRFVENGWSTKKLVREICLTRTYQLGAEFSKASHEKDAENLHHWRHSLRRLDAEAIRDAMLASSGQLDPTRLEGSLAGKAGAVTKKGPNGPAGDHRHRSVYLPVIRENVHEMMRTFDFADPSLVFGKRDVTTVPTQALFLMNNGFVQSQSDALAQRVLKAAPESDEARVAQAFRLTLAREPNPTEATKAAEFLAEARKSHGANEPRVWSVFAQALYQSAEFRYLR